VVGGHAHLLELHLHVAVWGIVVTKNRQGALDLHAGCIGRHHDHRLLGVPGRLRVGFAHQDKDGAARVTGTGGPPFAPVDDQLVAVALDAALDVGGVGRGDFGFGHQEGRTDFTAQQGVEPAVFERLAGVALQRFHVAGVGGRAVEHLGGKADTAHDLAQRGVLEVAQALGGARGIG